MSPVVTGCYWLIQTPLAPILNHSQRRHDWILVQSSSDYKVTFPQYLDSRPRYLGESERPIWRQLDILCEEPEGYESSEHEECWDEDSPKEILDGTRVANYDEVPFTVDWTSKQLVLREGERVSLSEKGLKRLKKYREGTALNSAQPATTDNNG